MNTRLLSWLFLFVLILAPCSFAWDPMEPAPRTLIILVHGINPPQGGLFRPNPGEEPGQALKNTEDHNCNDESGNAHIWKSFGMSPFLRENVVGDFHHVYAQGFSEPQSSPVELAHELGDRDWSISRHCKGARLEMVVGQTGRLTTTEVQVDKDLEMKSLFRQAQVRWFEGEKLLANSTNPSEGDPDVRSWLLAHSSGGLSDLERDHPEWVPSRFVVIAHSMGGLTTREYLTSSFYQGEIDKVITLDTPHNGSWAVELDARLLDEIDSYQARVLAQNLASMAGALYVLYDNNYPEAVETMAAWVIYLGVGQTGFEAAAKYALYEMLAKGYTKTDGSIRYMTPSSSELKKANAIGALPSGYSIPAFRLFYHKGVPAPGNPDALATNSILFNGLFPSYVGAAIDGLGNLSNISDQSFANWALATEINAIANMNFYDDGTIVVPTSSSRGDGVQLLASADTRKQGYTINMDAPNAPAMIMANAILRQIAVNKALGYAAKAAPSGWDQVFKALKPVGTTLVAAALNALWGAAQQYATCGQLVGPNGDAPKSQDAQDQWLRARCNDQTMAGFYQDMKVLASSHDYATKNSHVFKKGSTGNLVAEAPLVLTV